mmetsp:Transcript_68582/g.165867  ORF Transcript_68582/g.165867 Transcript_68582/m.165867 type:complete len:219 (+) Transcript_68582:212-868(+)
MAAEAKSATELIDAELVDAKSLPLLEAHLTEQCAVAEAAYDSRINTAILRLYAFYPQLLNPEMVTALLAKALTTLPEPHFHLVLCQIPESLQSTPAVAALTAMEAALQTGHFARFWDLAASADARSVVEKTAGFAESIRDFIVLAMSITYSRVETARLARALNLDAAAIAAQQEARGWTVEGDSVVFKKNAYNAPKPRKFKEGMAFSELRGVMDVIAK